MYRGVIRGFVRSSRITCPIPLTIPYLRDFISIAFMNPFEALGLREEILTSLRELNFEEPTPIQAQAIPFILKAESA